MFARFRQVRNRLDVSLVETVRVGARVSQKHIASLGSVPLPPSPADRLRFWAKADQRLRRLGNRLDDKAREAILGAIHARIPLPAGEDLEAARHAARNADREANARLFAPLRDKHRSLAEAYGQAAEKEAAAAKSVDVLEDLHASRPLTARDIRELLKALGMTNAELRHCRNLAEICEHLGEDRTLPMLAGHSVDASQRARRRLVSTIIRYATRP